MEKEKKRIALDLDIEDYQALEGASNKEHLALATWCKQKLLWLAEGRLVEKSPEPCECPKG